MSDSADRTAAEREAARLERERRRAQRRRDDGGAEADAGELPDVGLAYESDGGAGHEDPPSLVLLSDDDGRSEEDDDGVDAPAEEPAGTRRVSGVARARSGTSRKQPGRGRGPRRAAGARKPHSLRGRIASVIAIALGVALIWFLIELFQPFHGSGHGSITVAIPAHSSSSTIGDQLAKDGVISSSFFFELRATLAGERGDLRPGRYHLKLGMSYGDVLEALTKVPPPAKVTNLTIIEGRTRREVDVLLRHQGLKGSYFAETRHSRLLDPVRYGAPRSTPTLEGFLFPSTYQVRDPVKISALIADQLATFKQRFRSINTKYARSKHLTPYDVLIIASMVEAESATAHDRPLVASVIYNRLAQGMPLQIDATTRYATGNYTKPLTVSELNSPSPYNTRIHKGLTPTPIDNPGIASIEAAAHPARTNFLYFVVKPCGNGEQAFTGSFKVFQSLEAKYNAARNKRGGRSPEHC